jgi:hypothetical protein
MVLTGSCLCGGVRFEIDGALKRISHCHCSMCRKAHGAAFATYAGLKKDRLRMLSDATLATYRSSPHITRQFCATCGSTLFWNDEEKPEMIGVALGTVDGDPEGRPNAHIHVASKAPWVEITDALPKLDGDP